MQTALPEVVEVRYAFDTSPVVELSVEQIYHTVFEAFVLIFWFC